MCYTIKLTYKFFTLNSIFKNVRIQCNNIHIEYQSAIYTTGIQTPNYSNALNVTNM